MLPIGHETLKMEATPLHNVVYLTNLAVGFLMKSDKFELRFYNPDCEMQMNAFARENQHQQFPHFCLQPNALKYIKE